MGLTAANIMGIVDRTLDPEHHGKPLHIVKFLRKAHARANPYNYAENVYAEPVEVIGRGIVRPSSEVVSSYGGTTLQFDLLVLISRLELVRKFPEALENDWITNNDRVIFRGNEYNIHLTRPSGQVNDLCTLLVLFCNTAKGSSLGAP